MIVKENDIVYLRPEIKKEFWWSNALDYLINKPLKVSKHLYLDKVLIIKLDSKDGHDYGYIYPFKKWCVTRPFSFSYSKITGKLP